MLNIYKQGRKRPLDTPKRMIERRERERKVERDIEREGEIREIARERERERKRGESERCKRDRGVKGIERGKE